MQKGKKFLGITQNLNKMLTRALQAFSCNTEWTDINNWLQSLEAILKDYPSPYITEKILLSKRLNQCMNPILPAKIHQCVLRIHEIIFYNMRVAVEGDINQYIRLFSEDLGVYSISLLPYFSNTSENQHRLTILKIIKHYYLDLAHQLIPMLGGLIKSLLSVYCTINNESLKIEISQVLVKLMLRVGRRYVIGIVWSCILKFKDCKQAGIQFLGEIIDKMEFSKEEDFSDSHGFSEEEQELRKQMISQDFDIIQAFTHLSEEECLQNSFSQKKKIDDYQQKPNQYQNKQQSDQLNIKTKSEIHLNNGKKITALGLKKIKEEEEQDDSNGNLDQQKHGHDLIMEQQHQSLMKRSQNLIFKPSFINQAHQIKLQKVPLMITPGIQSIKEGIDANSDENNFPNFNTLVISALISCLQDQKTLVKKTVLDFMWSHLRIKSPILSKNQKKIIVHSLILLYRKNEVSIIKKINRWLFGKQDQENQYIITDKNQFIIPFIIEAFQHILQQKPKESENCSVPLKILQNFYIQHPNLIPLTLKQITLQIIRYIFNFGSNEGSVHFNQQDQQILKVGKRFLQNLPSHYNLMVKSLGQAFLQGINLHDSHKSFQAVQYMNFCYMSLMKHDHDIAELQYITTSLELLGGGLKVMCEKNILEGSFIKDTLLLAYNLISRRQSVIKYNIHEEKKMNQEYLQETGDLNIPLERQLYQKQFKNSIDQQQMRYVHIAHGIQCFFTALGKRIKVTPNIQKYQQPYRLCSFAVIKIQMYLPFKDAQQLPLWFSTIEYGIKVSNPFISLSAIEAMIKCFIWENKHPVYNNFKIIVFRQKNKKVGTDYQKLALQKLWSLLDFPHMHSKIIDLIFSYSKYFPFEFTETIKKSFSTHIIPQKEASIQRFSHFWRMTSFKYKDLIVQNRQFLELKKVGLFMMLDFLDDSNPLVRHAAKSWLMECMSQLSRIIQPLFHELVLNCSDWYETPKGIYVIKNIYNTSSIFNIFRRIRSILSNGSYAFLRYVYQTEISDNLQEYKQKISDLKGAFITQEKVKEVQLNDSVLHRQPVLPKALQQQLTLIKQNKNKMMYLDLLVILAMKYIQGHGIESMGISFYLGNSGVNTSAIQLIQTLLDYIDNPSLCQRIINYILEPILLVLQQVVLNQQYIIQIQLLNLIRSLLFNSSFRMKGKIHDVRIFFQDLFTNRHFLNSVLNGLKTPFGYVRSQFISFITSCIPLIADFLQPEGCTYCIRQILFSYYQIIKKQPVKDVLKEQQKQEKFEKQQKIAQISPFCKILELQNKVKMDEKYTKLSNNFTQMLKTTEVLSVLHGIQGILNYFYDLNKLNINELKFQFSNPYTLFDTFKSIITLGLASSSKDSKIIEKKQFLHNLDTCQSILSDLLPVYQTIIRAWPLSEEFVRIATQEFSSVGMKAFNFQRFSRYNKVVKKLIEYVENEKQSIWGRIFSIMQPMYYRFPQEITDIHLKLWVRQCTNITHQLGHIQPNSEQTEFLMKILETIIINNIPMKVVIHAFLQSTQITSLNQFYVKRIALNKSNILDYQINKIQAKLLYFLYVYFNYSYLNQEQLNQQTLLQIWSLILKSLNSFKNSKNPLVGIWIIEVINLCARKYQPKQLLSNQKFKSDLHALINSNLQFIASVAICKQKYFFQQFSNVTFDKQESQLYHLVLPLPSTIYEIHQQHQNKWNSTDQYLFKDIKPGENIEIQTIFRLYCFKVLKKWGLQILQNTYLPQKIHWVIIRTTEWINILLPIISDKSSSNMLFAECASEVLYNLLDHARLLFIKTLKLKVLQIFNRDDFFICNVNTLNYWSKIIDWIVSMDKHNQTFIQYLSHVTLSNGYFTNSNHQNKTKIKSFARICFILYSGSQDKYVNKIKVLLQKIADVIKISQTAHPALLILILFCIRILILKLSQICLNQLFIDIWPMLLALLMQIFSKQYVKVEIENEISKNPNLLLAALKLIEMISLRNLSAFANHQWIFVWDYFGVTLRVPILTSQLKSVYTKIPQIFELIPVQQNMKSSPFIYHPFLTNFLPVHSVNYIPKSRDKNAQFSPIKRNIIIKQSYVNDENQLKIQVLVLMQYLNYINQFRTQVNQKQIENVIVNDFIQMQSFIYKIK